MAATTIAWCDHSVNPIRALHKKTDKVGHYCEKVAAGCLHCYSSRMQHRFGLPEFGGGQLLDEFAIFLDESKLEEVRRRKKPTRYFWEDMSDLFGDWVQKEWLAKCFATMDATPQHVHMLLTKRPENIRGMWPPCMGYPDDLGGNGQTLSIYRPNVWLGTSVSDQETFDDNIAELLACAGCSPVLFLSAEPLLGPIDLSTLAGLCRTPFAEIHMRCEEPDRAGYAPALQWVITGCESGPKRRPFDQQWDIDIERQCAKLGTTFFRKQIIVGGRVSTDPTEWPNELRRQEFPDDHRRPITRTKP